MEIIQEKLKDAYILSENFPGKTLGGIFFGNFKEELK